MSKKTIFRVENVDDVNKIADLVTGLKVLKMLNIPTSGVKTLDQAKSKIIENFSMERAQEIYQNSDRDPMQIALKENETNRTKLARIFKTIDAFLGTLSRQSVDDLNRCFPDYNKTFRQRERDLERSSCYILVAGETGAGKSSIINLLLGCEILPTSDLQATANICELRQSDKKYYVLYHKERRKTPEIFDYDESTRMEQFLENMAVHICMSHDEDDDNYYEKIEIYWPFPFNMENMVFVDTPGIGDDVTMSASLQKYMNRSFGFIYVVNSAAAGGIHRDRLGRLLRLAQERGDEDFDPSAAIFVCNKHDLLKENEVAGVMDVSLEKLQGCYPGVERDQLFPISCRQAMKTAEYGRGILKEHSRFVEGIRLVLPKIFHAQLSAHYRWLASVIKRTLHTLRVTKILDERSIEDHMKTVDDVKSQMAHLAKRADDRIKMMKADTENAMQKLVKDILHVLDQNSPELSMWGPNSYPQPDKDWKVVAKVASNKICDRIIQLIDDWDQRHNIVSQIKQQTLEKFQDDLELFEDQIKQIEGAFLGGETRGMNEYHQAMKPKSNVKAIWKTNKGKDKAAGALSIGVTVGEATLLNPKNNEVKRIFKDYNRSSKAGELMRQATMLFIQDLTVPRLTESLKRYFTRMTRDIDEISLLIPRFIDADRELIKTLTANVKETEERVSEVYPQLIVQCTTLRSQLDMFYCMKLMKTDFQFSSFKIGNNKMEIGEGTFAKVYKSTMPNTNLPVALKVCKDPLKDTTVSDVLLEHQTSRELRHRNIIRYYGSTRIVSNGLVKFVMVLEFCQQTLQELLRTDGERIPGKSTEANGLSAMLNMSDLASQICSGLGYLHQKSIVHRDLKTENILVNSDRVVKLSDLGLAKMGLAVTLQVGSPVYMAPEVLIQSNSPYDTKADIYSVGIMLWELWYGQDVADHIQMLLSGSFEESIRRGLRPSLTIKRKPPADWQNMIKQCWSKDAFERPKCSSILDFFDQFIKAHSRKR